MNRIKVHLDKKTSSSHEIYIGKDIIDRMSLLFTKHKWGSRYIILTDSIVSSFHGERVQGAIAAAGLKVDRIDFPAGEASKDIRTCLNICDQLIERGVDRTSALIALGGGIVGDITGFVASIYMRGIPYIQVPTTLLAQVDSSIGGKTGIDLLIGKNILGTFYQPRGVFIDLAFLQTLELKGLKNGLAEIGKNILLCADKRAAQRMEKRLEEARKQGESLGGIVAIVVRGYPPSLGDPVFDKIDADLAKALMSIGTVKGVEIGAGFRAVRMMGSESNDPITPTGFTTNHAGGILAGITTGAELCIRVACKPIPSIEKAQQTIDVCGRPTTISIRGKHDVSAIPRIIPVCEAMVSIVLADHLLRQQALVSQGRA